MGKTERVWRSDVAKKLLENTGSSTIEEAVPLLIEKRLSMFSALVPPVDLRMVASVFGISSHFNYVDMPSAGRLRCEDKKYFIDVNGAHNPQRQRFSIAHEIGHKALLEHGIYNTKHRGSAEYTAEEREEEELCHIIGAEILGLGRAPIQSILQEQGLLFSSVEQYGNKCNTSLEATLRAFLRYCPFPAAGMYCEMYGGLIAGVADQFIVRRAYYSVSFASAIPSEHVFSGITSLREAMRQSGKIIANTETLIIGDQQYVFQTEAKRMKIYVEEKPKVGVVMVVSSQSEGTRTS